MRKKIDRQKEMDELADRLGIGKDRDVTCIGCNKLFRFKDAVIISNNQHSSHLCKNCFQLIISGKLTEQQTIKEKWGDWIEQIKKEKFTPAPGISDKFDYPRDLSKLTWKDDTQYEIKNTFSNGSHNISSDKVITFIPKSYVNQRSAGTR